MSTALTRLKSQISSLASRPCKNPLRIIKCSFSSVILWLGATPPGRLKRNLPLHPQRKGKLVKPLLLPNKNLKTKNRNQQLPTKVKLRNLLKKKQRLKNPLSTLSTKMEITLTEFPWQNTTT